MKMIKEFYDFVYERESIRVRRLAGMPRDLWTQDEVLATWKFTNVKREYDRTTRELVEHFYPQRPTDYPLLLLNCAVARFFGLSATVLEIGYRGTWDSNVADLVRAVVAARQVRRDGVFTPAYIVPNCGDSNPKHEVVIRILGEVWQFAQSYQWNHDASWQRLIESMCEAVRGMGSFMAKEVVLDFILVTGWKPSDWLTWTPVGPGARRGAARVYYGGPITRLPSEKLALEWCLQLYDARSDHWTPPCVIHEGTRYDSHIEIELSDVQFQLCEFDKYLRVKLDGLKAKTKFTPS